MKCRTSRQVGRSLGFVLAALLAAADALAQVRSLPVTPTNPPVSTQSPPRDRRPVPMVGTAAMKGRVVDGVTGNAIARARVRIVGGPGTSKPPVLTDGVGAFEFTGLAAGSYTLMAEKSTYIAGRHPETGRSMRARAQPLVLANGQVVEDVAIQMFRGAAITGRVVDSYGDPVDMAQVRLLRVQRGGRPQPANQVQTNDLGEFRVPRLQAGRYLVQIRPNLQMMNVFQGPNAAPEAPLPQPLPTYYPSGQSLSHAQPITVNRGETVSGIEVVLAEGTPTVVSGVVMRSDGEPVVNGSVTARVVGNDAVGYETGGGSGIRQGGMFQLLLPPGDYALDANVMARQGPGPMGPEDQLSGSIRMTVGGGMAEGVNIMVGRGATATGRVIFDGTAPPPPSPGQAHVPFYNPEGPGCRAGQATIAADWTFKIDGLSGTCGAPPSATFGRWTLKSITLRGQSLLGGLVTFETGQQYSNIQVVVTDKRTQMDLRVSGDDGQLTREYVVIVFPIDKARWDQQLRQVRTYVPPPLSALSRLTPPGGPGPAASAGNAMRGVQEERLVALTPGEYFVIAVDDIDSEDWQDPTVLERLSTNAIRVVLTEDAPVEVPLRRFTYAELMR
jgi:hypothetical protein